MHPSELIVLRAEALLRQALPGTETEAHRTRSLSDDQGELPAQIVSMGADVPLPNLNTFDQLGSGLILNVSWIDRGSDEKDLMRRLTTYRSRAHAALMTRGAFGFEWVVEVGYLGANEPITDARATMVAKDLTARWQVAYLMNRTNPDIPE